MFFIDTHTHLFSPSVDEDRTAVVERAVKAGVEILLLPNIDLESIVPMYELCKQFPQNCFPMMGLHPGSVDENWESNLEIIRKNLFERKNYAVGEIGMDLYWDKTFQAQQAEALDEIFEIVDELNDERLTGVFHCFTGTVDQAKRIQNYGGFKIGIGGVLTYKKAELDLVLKEIDLSEMILETDAPYLPPTPHRGKRNESAYLLHIAEKLADVKECTLKVIADTTTATAKELFKLS